MTIKPGASATDDRRHRPRGASRGIQDPISFRCATHVHGAASQALVWARDAVGVELNAAADNPLIPPDDEEIPSTGDFHAVAVDQDRRGTRRLASRPRDHRVLAGRDRVDPSEAGTGAHLPPSTLSTCPVIQPAWSEAKNSTAAAMSSGVPRRFNAMA